MHFKENIIQSFKIRPAFNSTITSKTIYNICFVEFIAVHLITSMCFRPNVNFAIFYVANGLCIFCHVNLKQ